MIERQEAEDEASLKALRVAARIGIADIEAGRLRTLEAAGPLRRHLAAVAEDAIAGQAAGTPGKR